MLGFLVRCLGGACDGGEKDPGLMEDEMWDLCRSQTTEDGCTEAHPSCIWMDGRVMHVASLAACGSWSEVQKFCLSVGMSGAAGAEYFEETDDGVTKYLLPMTISDWGLEILDLEDPNFCDPQGLWVKQRE